MRLLCCGSGRGGVIIYGHSRSKVIDGPALQPKPLVTLKKPGSCSIGSELQGYGGPRMQLRNTQEVMER